VGKLKPSAGGLCWKRLCGKINVELVEIICPFLQAQFPSLFSSPSDGWQRLPPPPIEVGRDNRMGRGGGIKVDTKVYWPLGRSGTPFGPADDGEKSQLASTGGKFKGLNKAADSFRA
jgi:hypothetical protein